MSDNNINGFSVSPISSYFQQVDPNSALPQNALLQEEISLLGQVVDSLVLTLEDQVAQDSSSTSPNLYNANSIGNALGAGGISNSLLEIENAIAQELIALLQAVSSEAAQATTGSGSSAGSSSNAGLAGNAVIGNGNTIEGADNTTIGSGNQDLGNQNIQAGFQNAVIGVNDVQVGSSNAALGIGDAQIGNDTTVIGNRDRVTGSHDTIEGNRDTTTGSHNNVTGTHIVVDGNHDQAMGSNIQIIGSHVKATGSNIHVYLQDGSSANHGTVSATSGETIVGNKDGGLTTVHADGSFSETNSEGIVIAHGNSAAAQKAGIAEQVAEAKSAAISASHTA